MTSPEPSAFSIVQPVYEQFAQDQRIPGLVAGVVHDGRLVHLTTVGFADVERETPVTAETGFRIASMTKNVTALAVLMLRDAGAVRLEAPAGDYVPELAALPLPTRDSRAVSVRDLLSHVAGLVTDDPWGDRLLGLAPADFTALLATGGLFAQAPETAFEYSNLGYALLGRVIGNVTGRPYQDWIGEMLLGPLGMASTTFDVDRIPQAARATGYRRAPPLWPEPAEPDGEFGAMGGLTTNALDYARYVAFLLDAWPPRDGPETGPARRASIRELALAHAMPGLGEARQVGGAAVPVASAYGYGLVSSSDARLGRYLHHAGGLPGYGSHVLLAPDAGLGLFAFANRTYPKVSQANIAAADALLDAGLWTPRPVALDPRLATVSQAVATAYRLGRIAAAEPHLAPNLLLDVLPADYDAQLAALKLRLGDGALLSVTPRHALAGRFVLACERGQLTGELILAPGPAPKIQKLTFDPPPA
ncbi:serine hydrolase [Phenylobacterium sp.]|uniref:serine hydrolase domain-containing protein n=1 Tax=Phenylobacterium sp. TaxID=1871053 RepID=UPI0025FDDFC0|nr:serine hydrolase [Phenylobacterium sp.]